MCGEGMSVWAVCMGCVYGEGVEEGSECVGGGEYVGGDECGEGVEEVGCELWGGGECVGCVECVGRGWREDTDM